MRECKIITINDGKERQIVNENIFTSMIIRCWRDM